MKKVLVVIEADGTVRVDAVGFRGSACVKATEAIERALGKPTGGGKKPEFHQTQSNSQGN